MGKIVHGTHRNNGKGGFQLNQSAGYCIDGTISSRGNHQVNMLICCFFSQTLSWILECGVPYLWLYTICAQLLENHFFGRLP